MARPAFESYMHRQHQSPGSALSRMFKRGYWLSYPASDERARRDGGWAERESPTGPYKSTELQAAWILWLASWMAIAEFRAFPIQTERRPDGEIIQWACPGLTKRELFAAMAMAQLSVTYALPGTTFAGKVAEQAVEYADALLKELAK